MNNNISNNGSKFNNKKQEGYNMYNKNHFKPQVKTPEELHEEKCRRSEAISIARESMFGVRSKIYVSYEKRILSTLGELFGNRPDKSGSIFFGGKNNTIELSMGKYTMKPGRYIIFNIGSDPSNIRIGDVEVKFNNENIFTYDSMPCIRKYAIFYWGKYIDKANGLSSEHYFEVFELNQAFLKIQESKNKKVDTAKVVPLDSMEENKETAVIGSAAIGSSVIGATGRASKSNPPAKKVEMLDLFEDIKTENIENIDAETLKNAMLRVKEEKEKVSVI